MMFAAKHKSRGRTSSRRSEAGLTLVEVMIASTISVIVLGSFVVFTSLTTKSILGISTQSTQNRDASLANSSIHGRIRYAIHMTNSADSLTLGLGYDSDYAADSDGDGIEYNDRDFYELFLIRTGDGDLTTVADNQFVHVGNATNTSTTNVIIKTGIRVLFANTNFFTVTNDNTVFISFGLLDDYENDQAQMIELRTTAVSRNIK
jgi:hypothetical protein